MIPRKTEHVAALVAVDEKRLLECAARLERVSLSAFMRSEVLESARNRIAEAVADGRLAVAE